MVCWFACQLRGRPSSGGGKEGGGKIQLFSVDELVSMTANIVGSLCEHLESTSGFFQVCGTHCWTENNFFLSLSPSLSPRLSWKRTMV